MTLNLPSQKHRHLYLASEGTTVTGSGSWESFLMLPDPDPIGGMTITSEPIWDSSAGRDANGKMQGTLKTTKMTLACRWASMNATDFEALRAAISRANKLWNGFPYIRFRGVRTELPNGGWYQYQCYLSSLTWDEIVLEGNALCVKDVSISFIQR